MPPLGALIRKRRVQFSSGIDQLDAILSVSHGTHVQVLGSPGTGKTALALAYTAAVLVSGGRVAWVSPRAFPASRLQAHANFNATWFSRIEFFRPDLGQLLALRTRADLVIIEHYEHYVESRDDIKALAELLKSLGGASLVTGTLVRAGHSLSPFFGGFLRHGFETVMLSHHAAREVFAQYGVHTLRLTGDTDLQAPPPDLIPNTLEEPESGSPWGLETPRKRQRVFFKGSPGEKKCSQDLEVKSEEIVGLGTAHIPDWDLPNP